MSRETVLRSRRRQRPSLVLESTRYECSVRGLLVEVVATQQYRNPMPEPIEAVFNLVTPTDATFLGLRVKLDGRELIGTVQAQPQAASRYVAAIADGDGAVLLENPEPGQYVVNVGNLLPESEAQVVVRYALWLSPTADEVRLRLPTVLAPRYGTPLVAPQQRHATDLAARHAFSLHAVVEGPLAQASIRCPSHALAIERGIGGIGLRIEHAEMDRDVVLSFEGAGIDSATHMAADGEGTAVVMSLRLPAPARPPRAADIVFLLDASGSMAGDSIAQAGAALAEIATTLPQQDRFQVLMFGGSVQPMHNEWQAANAAGRANLRRLARRLHANLGGTDLVPALQACIDRFATLQNRSEAETSTLRERVVFIVSDGQVDDARLPALAARLREAGIRVFAVAVGAAPVRQTFEPLCEASGGAIEEAFPGEGMAAKVVRHFNRIGGPRWSVAAVEWQAGIDWRVLPDGGHGGDTLRLAAGLVSAPVESPRVRLCDDEGREVDLVPQLCRFPGDTLPRMAGRDRWAVERDADRRLEIALRFQLLTPETACIVISERVEAQRTDGAPRLVALPQQLPSGWGGMGQVDACSISLSAGPDVPGNSVCESFHPLPFYAMRSDDDEAVDETSDDAPDAFEMPTLLEMALDFIEANPPLQARLRTGLASVDEVLELLPSEWHAPLCALAQERGLAPQGLVVALLRELFDREIAAGERSPLDAATAGILQAAATVWPVSQEAIDALFGRLEMAAATA